MIAIIDYGAGNLGSVANAIRKLGYQPEVTRMTKVYERVSYAPTPPGPALMHRIGQEGWRLRWRLWRLWALSTLE